MIFLITKLAEFQCLRHHAEIMQTLPPCNELRFDQWYYISTAGTEISNTEKVSDTNLLSRWWLCKLAFHCHQIHVVNEFINIVVKQ